MAKYKVKNVEIDAFKYDGDLINSEGQFYVPDWAEQAFNDGAMAFVDDGQLIVHSRIGLYRVKVGDYIIKDHDGGIRPLNEPDFLETFELVSE